MSSANPSSATGSSNFKVTQPPNATWAFGQKTESTPEGREWMEGLQSGWTTVDTSKEGPRKLYSLLVGGIAPRPVAFVSSVSEHGIENLAPFSWFNQVSAFPPVISVSITRSAALTRLKDSVANIKVTKGFTVNMISEPWVMQANVCAVDAPEETSEWDFSGLTKEPSIHVKAPRVLESAFSMECELLEAIDIKDPATSTVTTTLVVASVKYIHVRNDMLDEKGHVDPGKFRPIARMGGTLYAKVNEGYHIERHTWQERGEELVNSVSETPSTRSP